MKKFKFRFQTVLEIRERELEKAELKVAEAQARVIRAHQELENLMNNQKNSKLNFEQIVASNTHIDITQVHSYNNYLKYLEYKIQKQHETIHNLGQELEKTRHEMLLIRQKKMMLDKLKEKDLKSYMKELEQLDLKAIDEMTSSRFGRT